MGLGYRRPVPSVARWQRVRLRRSRVRIKIRSGKTSETARCAYRGHILNGENRDEVRAIQGAAVGPSVRVHELHAEALVDSSAIETKPSSAVRAQDDGFDRALQSRLEGHGGNACG